MTDARPLDVLVTGATGYIGSRLVPALLAAGHRVRVLTRSADKLADRPWRGRVEVVEGDATSDADLLRALTVPAGSGGSNSGSNGGSSAVRGVDVAYYLLHSMDGQGDFAARDRDLAGTFARAAGRAGAGRVVYLGGLHPTEGPLSPHLSSRVEVGEILLRGPVPAVVLQAAVIVGSGSASFEMLRHLTERLPVMVAPRWLQNRIQPIAVRDVLTYLVGAAGLPAGTNRTFDIGGPDVLTYAEMIQRYAEVSGLHRRLVVTVPVLTPRLAGHWIGLVTPVPTGLAKPLVDSLIHEVVCHEDDLAGLVELPDGLLGYDEAVRHALVGAVPDAGEDGRGPADRAQAPTVPLTGDDPARLEPGDPGWAGPVYRTEERTSTVRAEPHAVWDAVTAVGGDRGWYGTGPLWQLRGLVDRVLGGPGQRRGRPDRELREGDRVDNWRVVHRHGPDDGDLPWTLRLRALTRLPGTAELEFTLDAAVPDPELDATADPAVTTGPVTRLRQVSRFRPDGLVGELYWAASLPAHRVVFGAMHHGMVAAAERRREPRTSSPSTPGA